LKRRCC